MLQSLSVAYVGHSMERKIIVLEAIVLILSSNGVYYLVLESTEDFIYSELIWGKYLFFGFVSI